MILIAISMKEKLHVSFTFLLNPFSVGTSLHVRNSDLSDGPHAEGINTFILSVNP